MAYTPMVLNCQPIIPFFSRPSFTILPRSSTVGFFSMSANQKLIETGQLTYVDIREGVTNSACYRFSQKNCSIHLFLGGLGDLGGGTYLHGLPSHQTEATPTYIHVNTQQVRCNHFSHYITAVQNSSYRLAASFSCPPGSLSPQHTTLLVRQGIRDRWSQETSIC